MSQLPVRMDTIPPPQKFQNIGDYNPIINGLPDPIHTATQTTLVSHQYNNLPRLKSVIIPYHMSQSKLIDFEYPID